VLGEVSLVRRLVVRVLLVRELRLLLLLLVELLLLLLPLLLRLVLLSLREPVVVLEAVHVSHCGRVCVTDAGLSCGRWRRPAAGVVDVAAAAVGVCALGTVVLEDLELDGVVPALSLALVLHGCLGGGVARSLYGGDVSECSACVGVRHATGR
jgi:hypothetical protein